MKSITKIEVEEFAIELFRNSAYDYLNGPEIAFDGSCLERESYGDVNLMDRLQHAFARLKVMVNKLILLDIQIHHSTSFRSK